MANGYPRDGFRKEILLIWTHELKLPLHLLFDGLLDEHGVSILTAARLASSVRSRRSSLRTHGEGDAVGVDDSDDLAVVPEARMAE
jgi:hypothetical protein